jgi:hypothetical protein
MASDCKLRVCCRGEYRRNSYHCHTKKIRVLHYFPLMNLRAIALKRAAAKFGLGAQSLSEVIGSLPALPDPYMPFDLLHYERVYRAKSNAMDRLVRRSTLQKGGRLACRYRRRSGLSFGEGQEAKRGRGVRQDQAPGERQGSRSADRSFFESASTRPRSMNGSMRQGLTEGEYRGQGLPVEIAS